MRTILFNLRVFSRKCSSLIFIAFYEVCTHKHTHKAKEKFQLLLEETAKYIKLGHHLELDPQISDRVSDVQPYSSTILELSVKPAETPGGV